MFQLSKLLSCYRRLKNIQPEPWVQLPASAPAPFVAQQLTSIKIQDYRDIKQTYKRGLECNPIPVSPVLGPIRVANPKVADKKYRWCSCGMSNRQPFCDDSHDGTLFKPLKFTIEEKVEYVELCGCKNSSKKPFCDGESCKEMKRKEDERLERKGNDGV